MTLITQTITRDLREIAETDLPWEEFSGARVLVSGATGMIPSYVVLSLLEVANRHNVDVKIYALVRNRGRAEALFTAGIESGRIELLVQDVTEPLPTIAGLTHIVHGASAAQPSKHASDPVGTLSANIAGTRNLLEAAREYNVKSFVLMSSAEVYGSGQSGDGMISETDYGAIDILNPRSCYSEGKRASETYAAVYNYQYGVPFTAARFGHIYGPGISLDDGRVQADFARDVITGKDITLKSAGLAERTYTYVADAVRGMLVAMLLGDDGAYNVSDEAGLVSIRELAQRFVEARPQKKLALRFAEEADQYATSSVQFQGLDSAKLRALGWKPRVRLDEGVDRFLKHLEEVF